MRRYLVKLNQGQSNAGSSSSSKTLLPSQQESSPGDELDLTILESDPGLRKKISEYHPKLQVKKCEDLMRQKQTIQVAFSKQSDQVKIDYRARLQASIDCIRFLLRQGLAFRGRDESDNSFNKGNFLELLRFLADHNSSVNDVVLHNASQNVQMIATHIQKDIISACAIETTNAIIRETGDGFFTILVDETRDISGKEQMAMVLRYIDQRGFVVERFFSIVHVTDTTAMSLKTAIEHVLMSYGLSLSRIRGQSYDGASNMQGEFNGLKALIMRDNSSAYYIHCFAHQLQLTLVAVAKNHGDVSWFFSVVSQITNVISSSCKRRDTLREKQSIRIAEALSSGDLQSGRGLNQEINLKRAGDTRWGSHYGSLINLTVCSPL